MKKYSRGVKRGERSRRRAVTPRHNQPMPAKNAVSRISEPQKLRVLQKFMIGSSVREISRSEGRSRECVTKIVDGEEARELVRKMRSELYGLADDAVAAVRTCLQQGDGRLGYKLTELWQSP